MDGLPNGDQTMEGKNGIYKIQAMFVVDCVGISGGLALFSGNSKF